MLILLQFCCNLALLVMCSGDFRMRKGFGLSMKRSAGGLELWITEELSPVKLMLPRLQ